MKSVNPVYSTFKGGYGSGWKIDGGTYPGSPYRNSWDYFCLWGHLRFCYDASDLIGGWIHYSIHGYRDGYTYTPVRKLLFNFNWHFAFNKKFPWIMIGFNKIEKYINYDL